MKHQVETMWMGKMQFNALVNGHTIIMDGPERVGGEDNGPIPKPLLLTALSGCTGMDVIAFLKKEGKYMRTFDVKVEGEISKQPPIEYTSIHLTYVFEGKPEDEATAVNCVSLSQEKFCGVSSMLKKIIPVTWEVIYNTNIVFSNQQLEEVTVQ